MRAWYALMGLIGLTLAVRVAHLMAVVDTPLFAYHRIFPASDMYLFDEWSERIANGDVLGREPYQPVAAWQLTLAPLERWKEWYGHPLVFYKAPFYPYLIAALRRLFGDPMLSLAILQIEIAAASVFLLLRIGTELVGPRAGWLGAMLFALYGPAIHYDVVMLRGPWIVLVSLLVTWQLIVFRSDPSPLRAGAVGLALGAALLVNEGFLLLPMLTLGLLGVWVRRPMRVVALSGAVVAGMAVALSPLIVRNVLVGAPPLALAVTGSSIFAVFNSADSSPYILSFPRSVSQLLEASGGRFLPLVRACLATFSGFGSYLLFYLRKATGFVVPYENPDNVNYYYAALKSPVLEVLPGYGVLFPLAAVGLALALRRGDRLAPLLPVTVSLFASIMLTMPVSRYRATLVVYLMPLAGVALAEGYRWARERRIRPLALALLGSIALGVAATMCQREVVFGGHPAGLFLYRAQEFVFGVEGYAREGRYRDALAENLALLRLNPARDVRTTTLAMLADLRVDRRDPEALRDFLREAVDVGGGDPEFLMAMGDIARGRLRDGAQARTAYEAALALHPSPATEHALRRRLGSRAGRPGAG